MKDILELASELSFNIKSLIEDDPIPEEVRFMFILLTPDKRGFHVEFGGRETLTDTIDFLDYQPLEGEFFWFFDYDIDEFYLMLTSIVDECFRDNEFKKIFEKKQLYAAIFGTNRSKILFV